MKNKKLISTYFRSQMMAGKVSIIDEGSLLVRCDVCYKEWSPKIFPGGKLKTGWWKCSGGCTDKILK